MYSIPPVPPPKSGSSHEASRIGTPSGVLSQTQSPRPAPVPNSAADSTLPEAASSLQVARPEPIEDPGDQWLPKILEDKSWVPFLFDMFAVIFMANYPSKPRDAYNVQTAMKNRVANQIS